MSNQFRIGFGYDVHQLTEKRKLFLGGIEIPHTKGLQGHSDADALLHSITDALLGSLSLGDIGTHFPNSDPKFKDIQSKILLTESYYLVKQKGYTISNIDATVVTEQPKLNPYILKIRESISEILNLSMEQVSVKATTSEKMGFVGEEKGIKVYAVVLIQKDNS
ncbi:2-c-methyl-d-erythritol 2,4-cyclodiphosphate synthase [hydrocarbon metagenome]|uniref:2-C-methyl-D-erythritol 2,4-cyclodiphosphate synthase n=1 Tax=hydrocarbon metagenome TaxID=938273 RepID=A0A0W8FZ49_9ZZZZ